MKVLILLILLVSNLHAATTQSSLEKKAINYYISGNYSGYLSQIIQLIKKYPQSPDSLFYLLTLKIDKNLIPDFDRIIPYYEKIADNKNIDFFTRQIALSELAENFRNKSEFLKAKNIIEKCNYIDRWKYTGPFNYSYYNDLNYNFYQIEDGIHLSLRKNKLSPTPSEDISEEIPPKTDPLYKNNTIFTDSNTIFYPHPLRASPLKKGEEYAKQIPEFKWHNLPYKIDYGWVPLNFLSNDKDGTIYTTTYFYLPEEKTIILWLTSRASIKTFVDHQLLFINDCRDFNFHLNNIYKITLKKGWHNLLIKSLNLDGSYDFKCRLMNEQGKAVKGIKFSLNRREPVKKREYISSRIYPKIYQYYSTQVANNTKKILDYYKFCLLDFHFFNENKALKNLERFIHLKTKNPFLNFLAGRIYMHRYNSAKKNDFLEKAKYYFNRVIETVPNFLRAKQYLAKYHIKKKNPDNAYNSLKKMNSPNYVLWGDYFNMINWRLMKLKNYSLETLKNPQRYYYSYLVSGYFEDYDINRSLALYTNLEKKKFQYLDEYSLLDIYLKQNNKSDFLLLLNKLYKDDKYNEGYYLYEALYEKRLGNHDKAVTNLKKSLEIRPSFKTAKELGNLLELCGDIPSALKYYKLAYSKKPYDIKLYKKISYIERKKIFYSLEDKYYNINVGEIIKEALQDKNENEELIKMYLDMMIIKPFPEGGYTFLIHQIFKILDDKGKEEFGEIKIPADNSYVINVKNYLENGEIIDAVDYKKHNDNYYISVPDLKIGSVIEVCYQVFYQYNWLDKTRFSYFSPFFFQDTDFNMKNSIMILVENMNIPPVKFNIQNDSDIEYSKKEHNNEIIHIWKKEDCPKLNKEYNSVPVLDLYPHILFSAIPDWDLFYNWYFGKILNTLKLNHDLEEKILEIFEESKERLKFNIYLYIKNCYYFIQENIISSYNYLYYPEPVELVYSRKKGSTEEKTLLMYYFLKKINIDCNLILVRNNHFSKFNFSLVYPEAFNSILLHIPEQKDLKKDIFLDFTQKFLPLGIINNKYVRTKGFLLNEKEFKFIDTPGFSSKDIIIENFQTTIKTNSVSIKGRILYSGHYNMNKEQYTDFTERENNILEYINSLINRISIQDYSITNLDHLDKNLKIAFSGELLPEKAVPVIFDKLELSKRYISKSKRETPLKIYYPVIKNIINEISIDEKYRLNLKDYHIKNDFGEYKLNVKKYKNRVTIERYIRIIPQVIEVERYDDFLKFCREVDNIEKEKLELL